MPRQLIVNADDFGMSPGITAGILQAHERGIVTSTSLMVRWPSATPAVHDARSFPRLALGLHLDIGEWVCRDDQWTLLHQVVDWDDPDAVTREVAHQLEQFRDLTGRNPTHIDSHQHFHLREPKQSIVTALARSIGVPLRGVTANIRYCGEFYGHSSTEASVLEQISVDRLIGILSRLPDGLTELACHPALGIDTASTYGHEREAELNTLCDPRVRQALKDLDIELISFADVAAAG